MVCSLFNLTLSLVSLKHTISTWLHVTVINPRVVRVRALHVLRCLISSCVPGIRRYKDLLHGSYQCCEMLRTLAWAYSTSGGELFLIKNDRCYAYNDRCQGKWIFPRLSYHSASSLGTYQPQCFRLLSDVNVFGGLFLC